MSLLDTIRAEHEAAGFPTVDSELGFRTVCPVCRQHSTVRAAGENDVEIECRSGCERIRVAEELHRLNSASWLAAEATGWRWIEEIVAVAPEEPDWIFEGYLAPGTKVMLAGQPKAGKTTWLMALLGAIANDAESFLGRRVRGGIVVALSEEGDATLAPKAENLRRHRVRVLNRDAAWPKPSWVDVINKAVAEAKRIEALMLVIDSLSLDRKSVV